MLLVCSFFCNLARNLQVVCMMIECFRRKLAQAKVLRVLALAIVLGEMALL